MALLAIIHLPDHTPAMAVDASELGTYLNSDLQGSGGHVVAIYEFPKRSELTCAGSCTRKGSGAWRRDKLGFMKCGVCGSRNRNVRRWLVGHLFDLLGANLYPDAPKLFQTPTGYGPSPQ